MSATPNSSNMSANSGTRVFRMGMSVLLFVVVCVGLYYLYKFLYGNTASSTSVDILTGTAPMTATGPSVAASGSYSANKAVAVTELTGIMDGGQYSTSFWVYISDTKGFTAAGSTTPLAHLMEISDSNRFASTGEKGNTLIYIGLNPINGTLVVRQTANTDTTINNSLTTTTSDGNNYPLDAITAGYNVGTLFTTNDKCDITNGIEYQRWVLITTVANGKTLDVYIDGKLARSCVYKAPFSLGSIPGKGTAYFGYNNLSKLKGFFSNGKFYNYALTPDAVWALYMAGPGEPPSISNFFSNLFSTTISFKSNAAITPGAATPA
jgi:hypothetical protein